jgi:hypothetical protein
MISRREFLQTTAGAAMAAGTFASTIRDARALGMLPLGFPLGGQVYPHRQKVVDGGIAGFAALMKDFQGLGIGSTELDSSGYREFASLTDGKEARKIMNDHGIICPSVHFTMTELRTKLGWCVEWNKTVGADQVSIASLGTQGRTIVDNVVSMDELKKAADEFNAMGDVVAKDGMIMTLHNEGFEHTRVPDGRLSYHVLFDLLNPKTVFMQYQMSSARTTADANPVALFQKYPNRFRSLHCQGIGPLPPPAPAAPTPPPAPPAAPAAGGAAPAAGARAGGRRAGGGGGGGQVAMGSPTDIFNWPQVLKTAKDTGGITNYFVEQNWELLVQSVAYLKTLNV